MATSLPPHLSHVGHPWRWGPQPHPQAVTGVKVQISKKPEPPGARGVEEAAKESDHGYSKNTLC